MSRFMLIAPLWLLVGLAGAAEPESPPRDPEAFARVAASRLQQALPDLHVELREHALIVSGTRGESLGMTIVDRTSLCRAQADDCGEALGRFISSNARIFRGVAEARAGHRGEPGHAEPLVTHAVWADDRAWLQVAGGELASVAPGGTAAEREAFGEAVVGLCAEEGRPVVATCRQPGCRAWTLRRRVAGQWRPYATVAAAKDEFVGLSCAPGHETLVTTRRLIDVASGREHAVPLGEALPASDTAVVLARPDAVFVGFNQGGQGGGLRRIDPRSGRVAQLEQPVAGHPCQGLLAPSCDPVQAIVTTPWDPACIAVAVGLVHRQTHGRIVEVCGDTLRRLYVERLADAPTGRADAGDAAHTLAFTGLGATGDELLAVGSDGSLRRVSRDGGAEPQPPAAFHRVDDVSVSFDVPDAVLVLTDVFRHDALGGALPLLVPR